jgi:hypothetical protein
VIATGALQKILPVSRLRMPPRANPSSKRMTKHVPYLDLLPLSSSETVAGSPSAFGALPSWDKAEDEEPGEEMG